MLMLLLLLQLLVVLGKLPLKQKRLLFAGRIDNCLCINPCLCTRPDCVCGAFLNRQAAIANRENTVSKTARKVTDVRKAMQQQHRVHAERATMSEVRRWLDETTQEGRADLADRVGPIAAALQRLSEEVREERAQAAEAAGDYTPHQLQALLCPALPCPALPCPALPSPALPCPALPCQMPCTISTSCPVLPCPALPCLALRSR